MPKRTLQQVIDDAKAGKLIDRQECLDTLLALHSMFTRSRMVIETIADKMNNADSLFYTTRAFLGSIDSVRMERSAWMDSVPAEWLNEADLKQREITSFWDSLQPDKQKQ
ncbi:hypothetical protein JGH11_10600 [Dysgonomonas sp. Marseille-P4677]|uniref:hypothetical protein n=1 Tax=Dysgonomonas sp. Marseille-P4677 TaxID=2364790 RepID=UPI0019143AA5|nr:hypothetical protein [Dysgonomonas sp. Marseille-P4677]MBK5721321.1 hypothetical protein [Dysgonomonas sp. Marseille-P4677]